MACCAFNTIGELSQNHCCVSIDPARKNGRIPTQALLHCPMDGGFADSVLRLNDDEVLTVPIDRAIRAGQGVRFKFNIRDVSRRGERYGAIRIVAAAVLVVGATRGSRAAPRRHRAAHRRRRRSRTRPRRSAARPTTPCSASARATCKISSTGADRPLIEACSAPAPIRAVAAHRRRPISRAIAPGPSFMASRRRPARRMSFRAIRGAPMAAPPASP